MKPRYTPADVDAYLVAWNEGYLARGTHANNPYDPKEDALRWRAWVKGYQAALLGASPAPGETTPPA